MSVSVCGACELPVNSSTGTVHSDNRQSCSLSFLLCCLCVHSGKKPQGQISDKWSDGDGQIVCTLRHYRTREKEEEAMSQCLRRNHWRY